MKRLSVCLFFTLAFCEVAWAATATWTGSAHDGGVWDTPGNWNRTPPNFPQSGDDVVFGATSETFVEIDTQAILNSLTFNAGAPSYSFTIDFGRTVDLTGAGVTNNSGQTEILMIQGSVLNGGSFQANLYFHNSATAGNLTLMNAGGAAFNSNGANIGFADTATAGGASITNNGGANNGATGGRTTFSDSSKGGTATITAEGDGTDTGNGLGALTTFQINSHAENATLITNGGLTLGSAGGTTSFQDSANGDTAKAITNAGGTFDISSLTNSGMDIGSIEGAGTYLLGNRSLRVGGNNLSTTVSGSINGLGGSIDKVGTGTLTLSGANSYTGGTTIETGAILVTSSGSLGSTPVTVNAGATFTNNGSLAGSLTLAGTATGQGVFNGPVTIQSGGVFSATSTVNGLLTVNTGALVSLTSGTLTAAGGVVNNGTMRFTHGATLAVTNGHTLTNNALLDVITGSFSAPAGFINNGTLLDARVVKAKSITKAQSSVTVTIDSYTGHTYQLQRSSSPQGNSFTNVAGVPVQNGSTGTTLSFTDPSPLSGHGFYRVAVDP